MAALRIGRIIVAAAFVLASVVSLGCGAGGGGGNTAHLKGTVTINGKPLPTDAVANILFKPTSSGQGRSKGMQVLDGKYDSPETPLGRVKVYIGIQQPTGRMIREGSGNPYPEVKSLVAPEYGSGIELNVTGDDLNKDFDLKSA